MKTMFTVLLVICLSSLAIASDVENKAPAPGTNAPAVKGESRERVHAYVSGVVQGVGFRAFTVAAVTAGGLKVTGWVRNLEDGRVEIVAEGTPEDLKKLMDAVAQGPRGSRVDKVEQKKETYTGEFKKFRVES